MLGILDLRSLGYYKIKQGILQQNLRKCYKFRKADTLCKHFNKFINTLKRREIRKNWKKNYPWLDPNDERKYMTHKEILDKYIELERSCLAEKEKKEVMEVLYKYKEAFSLRDEVGTCPNIEVEIDVMNKSPFFIRPYSMKKEDKALINYGMNCLCYLGILKEGFSAYSSQIMLISRKLTKDKRVVTDSRHLNVRIAKNNSGISITQGYIFRLGSSKCEVLSMLDLKDAFHSLRLSEHSKKYCGILPYFSGVSYMYQRMPLGLNISPSIWQSYINAILDCLLSRKYCETSMDDLLLFTPLKSSHMAKLEDLLKALLKNGLKISPKKCQLFRTNFQYMGNEIFIKDRKVCVKPLRSRLKAIQKLQPPHYSKRVQTFCRNGVFLEYILSRTTKIIKAHIWLNEEGQISCIEKRAARFLWGNKT